MATHVESTEVPAVELVTKDGAAVEVTEAFVSRSGRHVYEIQSEDGTSIVPADALVFETIEGGELSERIDQWWQQQGALLISQFQPSYWAAQWQAASTTKKHPLNHGTPKGADETTQHLQREANRTRMMYDVAQQVLSEDLAIGVALRINHESLPTPVAEALDEVEPSEPTHVVVEAVPDPIDDDITVTVHVAASNPDQGFQVRAGQSGAAIFEQLGMNETQWFLHAEELLSRFPQDFQRSSTGTVTVSHGGWLSDEAIRVINGWRNI